MQHAQAVVAADAAPILDLRSMEGRELLAPLSRRLALPKTTQFAPLNFERIKHTVAIAHKNKGVFGSHTTCWLPCDTTCAVCGDATEAPHDILHRFLLLPLVADPLNADLTRWALRMEEAAKMCTEQSGVQKSNWGGYQSNDDLFDGGVEHGDDGNCLAALHAVTSRAIDELTASGSERSDDGAGSNDASTRGACTTAASNVADWCSRGDEGMLRDAQCWLNVNRPSDINFTHTHEPGYWSAVYFAGFTDGGEHSVMRVGVSTGPACGLHAAGHLVFRGGKAQATADGGLHAGLSACSHSYMAVPPTPGSLWLFPGSVPHCVWGWATGRPGGGANDDKGASAAASSSCARVSVAMNFRERCPSPTTQRTYCKLPNL